MTQIEIVDVVIGLAFAVVGAVWIKSFVPALFRDERKRNASHRNPWCGSGKSDESGCDDDSGTAVMPGYVGFIIGLSLCYFGIGLALRAFGRRSLDYRVLAVLTFGWILPMVCHECVAIYRIIRERMTARKHRE